MPSESRETILVYRDRIVPRSEASFLRLQYVGFARLKPLWVGCRTDDGLEDLDVDPLILGGSGPRGNVDRALFKQFGVLPASPDLRALRPKAIHAHFGRGGALALPIARALQIPLVVTFHGGDATKETHYRRRLIPTIFQRRLSALKQEADAFVCVSDYIRSRLVERGFPPGKLHVIRYGVEMRAADRAEPSQGPPYVLFVGRFVEKKGIAFLIEAMRILEGRGADLRLVLVGNGPMAEGLKAQTASLKDASFLGWLPNSEVRRWMRGALAVCVPSIETDAGDAEGLPNVVIEAMAEGAPVVGSGYGGIAEALEDGVTGLLVPPGDPDAIATAIQRLATDPGMRAAIGSAARQAAAERFSAVAQSRLLERTLLSVILDAGPSRGGRDEKTALGDTDWSRDARRQTLGVRHGSARS